VRVVVPDSRQKTNVGSDDRVLSKDSVVIAGHMKQLNSIIGNLRAEKLDLTTQLRKQQLRITHLENLVDQLSKQVDIIGVCVMCLLPWSLVCVVNLVVSVVSVVTLVYREI